MPPAEKRGWLGTLASPLAQGGGEQHLLFGKLPSHRLFSCQPRPKFTKWSLGQTINHEGLEMEAADPAATRSRFDIRFGLWVQVITHLGTLCRRIGWCIHLTRGLARGTGNLREMTRVGDQKVLVGGKPRSAESATMATSVRGQVQYDANDARFQYRQHRRVHSRFAFAERAFHGHIETALIPRGH